ncbi:MAG TPA: hypothetical protein VK178_18915 [Opitutaceae bacterium]|nr:hypothetical protein [Opitutaceae bacterium]
MQTLLRTHAAAPNQVSDARNLAKAAGYESWRGMNLQYGLLGKRIAKELGEKEENLSLLAELVRPKTLSNKEWLVLMKPAFAKAVRAASWF